MLRGVSNTIFYSESGMIKGQIQQKLCLNIEYQEADKQKSTLGIFF